MAASEQGAKDTEVRKLRRSLERYRDSRGNSGITAYGLGPDFLVVEFKNGSGYLYDCVAPGRKHVEAMKRLAQAGDHLATYINRNVRGKYAKRLW